MVAHSSILVRTIRQYLEIANSQSISALGDSVRLALDTVLGPGAIAIYLMADSHPELVYSNETPQGLLALDADICRRNGDVEIAKRSYRQALEFRKNNVGALTGLAQLVPTAEAENLIAEAIKIAPDDSRSLLARARNATDPDVRVKDALAALESDPFSVEAFLFLATELAQHGDVPAAIEHIRSALDHLSLRRELLPNFVDTAIRVAVKDDEDQLSDLLATHENGKLVEPLKFAIQMVHGENPRVAKEIFEVAADIVARSMGGVPRMGTV